MNADPAEPAADLSDLPDLPDGLALVVADMDGTLLDARGEVPDGLWPLLDRLRAVGAAFAPASGRQYATLRRLFDRAAEGMVFIAENGAYVVRDGAEVSSMTLGEGVVREAVEAVRASVRATGRDAGVVVCGKRSAYVERSDAEFLDEVDRYYAARTVVDDLLEVDDDVLKVAVHDATDAEGVAEVLAHLRPEHQVVVSGAHWVDVMGAGVHKGTAVRRLQEELGAGRHQSVAFGDYLNDLEMLDAVDGSFAMADAHPEVAARARYRAGSHVDGGVLEVLEALLRRLEV